MSSVDDLRTEMFEYDGRTAAILSDVAARHRGDAHFLSNLVTLAADPSPVVTEAATWILKAELEAGQRLAPEDITCLTQALKDLSAWQAQLHVCQSLRYIDVQADQRTAFEAWMVGLLVAPRPLLRAWAIDGLCRLRGPSVETRTLLAQMEADKAASVRARVRNLKKDLGFG